MRFEELQGLAHRLRRGHIDAGLFEQFNAVVGRAGTEKLQVAVDGWLAFLQDLLREGRSGRDARRVLVDIEAAVEVGNARPLDVDQFVDEGNAAIVFLVERAIERAERIRRQRLAPLGPGVNLLLEFGEHGLTEERAAEAFQRVIENSQFEGAILARLKQVVGEQRLVERGCDLGHEDGVVAILEGLVTARVERVHGVAQFVRQREHAVAVILEVQQDEGEGAIGPAAIGAAALIGRLEDIDPPLVEALHEMMDIVLAQWRERLRDDILRLLVADLLFLLLDNRHVKVIHVQFIELQHALAQLQIAIQQGDMFADRLDQIEVDAGRNIVTRQRVFQTGRVVALSRIEHINLDLRGKGGSERVALFKEGAVQALKGGFAHGTVVAANEDKIVAMRQLHLLALLIGDGRQLQVGIVNHAKGRAGSAGHFSGGGEDGLDFGGTHMPALAVQIIELLPVEFQARGLLDKLLKLGLRQRENFRLDVGSDRRRLNIELHGAVEHRLISAVGGILIFAHGGIDKEAVNALKQMVALLQDVQKRLPALRERSLKVFQSGQQLL